MHFPAETCTFLQKKNAASCRKMPFVGPAHGRIPPQELQEGFIAQEYKERWPTVTRKVQTLDSGAARSLPHSLTVPSLTSPQECIRYLTKQHNVHALEIVESERLCTKTSQADQLTQGPQDGVELPNLGMLQRQRFSANACLPGMSSLRGYQWGASFLMTPQAKFPTTHGPLDHRVPKTLGARKSGNAAIRNRNPPPPPKNRGIFSGECLTPLVLTPW